MLSASLISPFSNVYLEGNMARLPMQLMRFTSVDILPYKNLSLKLCCPHCPQLFQIDIFQVVQEYSLKKIYNLSLRHLPIRKSCDYFHVTFVSSSVYNYRHVSVFIFVTFSPINKFLVIWYYVSNIRSHVRVTRVSSMYV